MRSTQLRHIHRVMVLVSLLMAGAVGCARAQFRDMTGLPWCPPRPTASAASDVDVLGRIDAAIQAGEWQQVVEQLYPQAIQQGYQRNERLYDQTRTALRQLLQQEGGERWNSQMQHLYAARYEQLGRTPYQYVNCLDTRAWCDEQLQNEQVLCLAQHPDQLATCLDLVRSLVQKSGGRCDLALVTLGMYAPLNREHARHPERTAEYQPRYAEILACLQQTEAFMTTQHPTEYQERYRPQQVALLRDDCLRLEHAGSGASLAAADASEYHAEEEVAVRARRLYEEAVAANRSHQYAEAYQKVGQVLQLMDLAEAHHLKCTILQNAANAATEMDDKVAFWCAAYEAGQGYADRRTLSQLLSALRSHLFMSGLAGRYHTTSRPIHLRQHVWTMEQLKKMGN